jgi:hypothetical protein
MSEQVGMDDELLQYIRNKIYPELRSLGCKLSISNAVRHMTGLPHHYTCPCMMKNGRPGRPPNIPPEERWKHLVTLVTPLKQNVKLKFIPEKSQEDEGSTE